MLCIMIQPEKYCTVISRPYLPALIKCWLKMPIISFIFIVSGKINRPTKAVIVTGLLVRNAEERMF